MAAAGSECSGKGTRVVPDMPEMSVLYLKIEPNVPAPCGSKMPLDGTPLTEDQATEVEDWIMAGAMND